LLVFVLDTAGSEGRNPVQDLGSLRRELDLYDPTLSQRPWIIAANKMDLPGAEENLAIVRSRFSDRIVMPTAAADGVGIEDFKRALQTLLGL
jgi:GTPase